MPTWLLTIRRQTLRPSKPYLVVKLDEACRRQQYGVKAGSPTLQDVPEQAISMSIRQILKSRIHHYHGAGLTEGSRHLRQHQGSCHQHYSLPRSCSNTRIRGSSSIQIPPRSSKL